jgi:signal transduction histidine kinase
MKLKTKMLIVVFLSCLAVFSVLYAAAATIILPSYKDIEDQETRHAVDQTLTTINYRLTELYEKVRDYAAWDDTYNFIQEYNQKFVADNLDPSFENLKLNIVIVADNDWNLVYCKTYDLSNSTSTVVSQQTNAYLQNNKPLWNFTSTDQMKTGIVILDNQPVLIAVAPVITSSLEGPIRGGMLFGRYLDAQEKQRLTEIMSVNFSLTTIDQFKLQTESSKIIAALNANPQTILLNEKTSDSISGYALINDIDGNPSFVLQVDQTREIYQHGLFSTNVFVAAALSLSILLAIIVILLLQKEIINPLTKLAADVKATFSSGTNGEKYSAKDTDEVSVLTGMIQDTVNQKLDAMNDVSRMVTHDLRNPLTGIKGAVYSLRRNFGTAMGEKGLVLLKVIDDCVEYSNKIVSDLWEYSSEIKLDKARYSPHQLVNKALTTLVIPKNIKIIDHTNDDFTINVDLAKMERVFSNLTKNAIDAMPDGGTIIISSIKLQNEAEIDFLDSGVGMSEEVAKKIGEPFFTTKAKGMGVGFSICKRIVEAHKGRIEVASTPGKGTKIMVFVPLNEVQSM